MPAKRTTTNATTARQRMLDQAFERVRQSLGTKTLDGRIRSAVEIAFEAGYVAAGGKPTTQPTEPGEMLDTLRINKTDRRAAGAGTWAIGTIAGHAFEALVFPEHAESEAYELDRSRISKLHLKEQATGREVACFDRGWDTRPTTDAAQQIVDLLAAGLAETVYGK